MFAACASGLLTITLDKLWADIPLTRFGLHEAMFYKKVDEATVQCELCPRKCMLTNGTRSFCRAREPKDGVLYSAVYGLLTAIHIDPIEKKPLFHMLPGSRSFSIATAGCNLRCKYCQNWQISQSRPEEVDNREVSPEEVVASALENNCKTIAYTYTEPTVFFEYMVDTAKIARQKGIRNVYHSGGFINPEPCRYVTKFLDGANVDLKGFDKEYLATTCQEELEPVLEMLTILKRNGVWLELTNLVVPTLNDNMDKIKEMTSWIATQLGPDTPLHFSRFYPQHKLNNLYPTPIETLEQARDVALREGLHFVYIGNIPSSKAEHTYCPHCKKTVIERIGYSIIKNEIKNGSCGYCNTKIAGLWE
ncbi:MAG: AmmeMemoRadiSam system radical SAM enzyme [Candidatus Omnitrophota bacterium]